MAPRARGVARAAAPGPVPGGSRSRWLALAAIGLAVLVAYWPSLGGGFVFDDHLLVERGPLLRGPLWRIWATADPLDYWPLTYSSLWLEWRTWGLHPLGYRLVSLLLHAGVAALLWRVLLRLRLPGAWVGGVLFALHPVAVESVAWISEQKNVLSGALFLGAGLAWLRFRDDGRHHSAAAAGALFLGALLAKTSTVILPPALLLAGGLQGRAWSRRERVWLAALFGMAMALGAVTLWFQWARSMGGIGLDRGAWDRIGGAAWAWAAYLWTAFQPFAAAVVYADRPAPGSAWALAPPGLLAGLAAVLWAARRRGGRPALIALGYHAIAVLPVLGFLDMAYLVFSPMGNHLQYLALMGPCALAGAGLGRLGEDGRRAWALTAAGLLALALGWHTWARASAYRDDVALWSRAVREAPESLTAARMLAGALLDAGRAPEALRSLEESASRIRDPASRLRARALLLAQLDRADEAIAAERAARALRDDLGFQYELGVILGRQGRPDLAVPLLQEVTARQPRSATNRYQLAAALVRSGRADEAVEELRVGCRLAPRRSDACAALALVLQREGRGAEARQAVAAAMGLSPADPAVDEVLRSAAPERAR